MLLVSKKCQTFYLDEYTIERINEMNKILNLSKSDLIRKGINLLYRNFEKKYKIRRVQNDEPV